MDSFVLRICVEHLLCTTTVAGHGDIDITQAQPPPGGAPFCFLSLGVAETFPTFLSFVLGGPQGRGAPSIPQNWTQKGLSENVCRMKQTEPNENQPHCVTLSDLKCGPGKP